MTPRAIAYWFRDDRAIKQKGRKGLIICTDGFEKKETVLLCDILKKNIK